MTGSSRTAKACLLLVAIFLAATSSRAQNRPPIVEQLAKAYGIDQFGQVEAIRYTFNIDAGALKGARSWIWEPKADRVSFDGKDKAGNPVKVTYVRSQLASQPDNVKKEVDPAFINDDYWLLFPFHVYWDKSADVQDKGMQKLPSGKGSARHVVVKYASDGGYTPGDTWELFLGPDKRVQEMVFRHGGNVKPSLVKMSWTGYKKAGPLLVSTEHRGTADDHQAHIFFTNVAVKMAGSDNWVEAK
jgi:hypothetical protein